VYSGRRHRHHRRVDITSRSRLGIFLIAGLLITGAFGSSTVAAEPSPDAEQVLALEEARHFRELFGFDASPKTLNAVFTDPAYVETDWGTPLTGDEDEEMRRRTAIELDAVAGEQYGSKQGDWAGYWFDQHDRGAPVFLFTGDLEQHRSVLEEMLRPDSGVRVELATRTLNELEDTKATIVAAWPELRRDGIHVTRTGIDIINNRVRVGVEQLDNAATATISDRFGRSIEVYQAAIGVSDACPTSGCRPIKGGIEMDGENGRPCTSGFLVRRTQHDARLAVLTAGHCIEVNNGTGAVWRHGGDRFGDGKFETWADNTDADVGIVEIDDSEIPAIANKVYLDPDGGCCGTVYTITGTLPDNNQTAGSSVCVYGFASNNSWCGAITDFDQANESVVEDYPTAGVDTSKTIIHTKEYDRNLIGGDSGGPVYKAGTGSGTRIAMGTHVHSVAGGPNSQPGWYSPYGWGRWDYGQLTGDWYYLCVTAACPLP
jgi:hypothetical protein